MELELGREERGPHCLHLLCARPPCALCHPLTLRGKRGSRCLRRGTCGRGAELELSPRAQVYTTSLPQAGPRGWGEAPH